jgi:hypothetical protein
MPQFFRNFASDSVKKLVRNYPQYCLVKFGRNTDSKKISYFSFPRTLNNSSRIWNSREGYPVMKFSIFIQPILIYIIKVERAGEVPPRPAPLRTIE